MKQFQELKEKKPELAEMIESMSKEELLNHYSLEVAEKEELEDSNDQMKWELSDLDCIVNQAKKWLVNNQKTKHYLHISIDKIELIYQNVESNWI